MKLWKLASVVATLILSSNANAAMVSMDLNTLGDGLITHDTVTGLNWLDLSVTSGMSYNDAHTNNPGWRYASNLEVEGLFESMFDAYSDNYPDNSSRIIGTTSTQYAQLTNFINLFGSTAQNIGGYIASVALYVDEDGMYRAVGGTLDDASSQVFGIEHSIDFLQYAIYGHPEFGTLMVSTSPVPVPPTVWLFGSGLLSLIGVARRKIHA